MTRRFAELAFTPAVLAEQERHGVRRSPTRSSPASGGTDALGPDEAAFIAERDSFYLASVSETGWPYVQHRGGPAGFVKVVAPGRIALADFRGNRQYVTAGNVSTDDRVALILMDYPNRQRLKVLGRMTVIPAAQAPPDLLRAVELPGYGAKVEHVLVIDVEAFDWNCPQHVTPRYTVEQVRELVAPLQARIAELEGRLGIAPAE